MLTEFQHFSGPVTYNQLISLGMSSQEITNCLTLGLTYDDMTEALVEQLMYQPALCMGVNFQLSF